MRKRKTFGAWPSTRTVNEIFFFGSKIKKKGRKPVCFGRKLKSLTW